MKKQARIGYSKYGLYMKIFYRNQVFLQPKGMSLDDPMVGWPEIWDMQSTENNKIWVGGLNGV